MISEAAIKHYLGRKLDSHDWLKATDREEVGKTVADLGCNPDQLWLHQQVCLLLMKQYPRFLLYLDPGGGKTRVTLEFLKLKKSKAIVFVPFMSAISTWLDEVQKWAPELKCIALTGTTEQNKATIANNDADLIIGCYQSVVAAVTERCTTMEGRGSTCNLWVEGSNPSAATKWVINTSEVSRLFSGYQTLILDEVHKCSNQQSLTYKMCRAIAKQVKYCYGLTGTPFSTDLQALWPQYNLIDWGHTLGPTLSFYREVFFTKKRNYWGGFDYKFRKRFMNDLKRIIKHRSIRYSVEEFADLPNKQYIARHIAMPLGAEQYIKQAKEELFNAVKAQSYELAGNSYLKLCQLSSGFLTFKGEGEKLQVSSDSNPKLDNLIEIVSSLPNDAKVVIFHNFIYSNQIISQALNKVGVKVARVWGGQKDPIGELKRFKEDYQCKALVINSKSGAASLNLQFAHYLIFFEQPITPADRIQAEARVWRQGQERRVIIYDLFVTGCLDEQRFNSNKNGRDLIEDLLAGKVV